MDVFAILETLAGFRDAWLRNDAEHVMKQLADDAVTMPHHGVRPRAGAAAIRAFWWPSSSPVARVTRIDVRHVEIAGSGSIAFVWGHSTVEYEWVELISHRMWDDWPTEDLGPVNSGKP